MKLKLLRKKGKDKSYGKIKIKEEDIKSGEKTETEVGREEGMDERNELCGKGKRKKGI